MEAAFAELAADLAPVYRRRDARANGLLYVRGLLMPQVAGNCWSIGEAVGLSRPYRLHHLLERAAWDEDAARDAVRAFLARHLGADGGVLIFDETGQAKKGAATAAVGRQYSGTMGRVENVIVRIRTLPVAGHPSRIAGHQRTVIVISGKCLHPRPRGSAITWGPGASRQLGREMT